MLQKRALRHNRRVAAAAAWQSTDFHWRYLTPNTPYIHCCCCWTRSGIMYLGESRNNKEQQRYGERQKCIASTLDLLAVCQRSREASGFSSLFYSILSQVPLASTCQKLSIRTFLRGIVFSIFAFIGFVAFTAQVADSACALWKSSIQPRKWSTLKKNRFSIQVVLEDWEECVDFVNPGLC